MKASVALAILALATIAAVPVSAESNPLSKVIELMDALTAKVTKAGEDEAKAYKEYFEWCEDFSRNKGFEIKTLTTKKEKLEATIAKAASDIDGCSASIEELAASIATSDAELKDATVIRDKEHADFVAVETELADGIETLGRAISVIEREMAKNPAALAQVDTTNLATVVASIGAAVDAAAFSTADQKKLVALVQAREDAADDDDKLGAPAPATYKTHSSSIVETLEDLKEKAEGELADAQKAEKNSQHNFDMLKQSLEDKMEADGKDMAEEKETKAAAAETKATAEGDLAVTTKALSEAKAALQASNDSCQQVATDHAASVKGRTAELEAIATAKKILEESTGGAVEQTYSLLQTSSLSTARLQLRTLADLANVEVLSLVKKLAQEHHSVALAQLASRISAVLRLGSSNGDDVFAKVKGLIEQMITKLQAQAAEEATEKAYCDDEMAKTEEKKGELEEDVAKLTAKIDQAAARSATLKDEVKELQAELAALAKLQAEMDKARADENAAYVEAKADLEQGLAGVRQALDVLREYYGAKGEALLQQPEPPRPESHESATGAGGGIISILEVVEADFSKNLAETEMAESDAQDAYDKTTQENKITKAAKEQDVKYKTKEHTDLDASIAEMTSDRDTLNTELSAVTEYYAKLKDRCIAKPETYEERVRRRTAEVAGLKEALKILEGEAAFMQRGRRGLRGRHLAA